MVALRKELFWDIDYSKLDIEGHKRLIIERVLTLGKLDEFALLMKTYDKQTLIGVISNLGNLDPKTISFVESYFGINKNNLRCYTKKQSTTTHWT